MIKWGSILAAVAGAAIAVYTVSTARHKPPPIPIAGAPSINPFLNGIAATGVVEGATRNLLIAAPDVGLVTNVFVEAGQHVKKDEALFELDLRPLQAELVKAAASLRVAEANVKRIEAQPRAEEVPPLEAKVREIEAEVADWQDQLDSLTKAEAGNAASVNEMNRRKYQIDQARARLDEARARLTLTKNGAWEFDKELARAEVEQAQASIVSLKILLDRRTVRAPIDATVLKRNVEPGQYAPTDPRSSAITLGDLSVLHVRARVDEEDLPRLSFGAKGVARIRGDRELTAPLKMVRIEPLAQPKTDLSGATTERVDTRVVEVIFEVSGTPPVPLYPGQLVDVFIDVGK